MKTVLITGCSSGIGAAAARAFHNEEWRVYATARDPEDLADLADGGCEIAELDVTDADQIHTVTERVTEETGRIDCLVNNAGYGQFGPLEDAADHMVRLQYDVNVFGPHRLMRAVLPHMRERGRGGIVNLSSVLARIPMPGTGVYAGSKAALEAASDALRTEVAGHGIDVVLVEPGPVRTNFSKRAREEIADDQDRSGAYESIYRLFEDSRVLSEGGVATSEPADVAAAILDVATCANPPARYPVGPVGRATSIARLVPDRYRDAAVRLAVRLVG